MTTKITQEQLDRLNETQAVGWQVRTEIRDLNDRRFALTRRHQDRARYTRAALLIMAGFWIGLICGVGG